MTWTQRVINWVSLAFAASLVVGSLVFAYVLLVPIDVVRNWKLTSDKGVYHAGETIEVEASYDKLMDVNGVSYYYLECQNPNGSLIRYPIQETEGNRPRGVGRIAIPLRIPEQISGLPATCHITISVDYTVYSFRKVTENNNSNDFEVIR